MSLTHSLDEAGRILPIHLLQQMHDEDHIPGYDPHYHEDDPFLTTDQSRNPRFIARRAA